MLIGKYSSKLTNGSRIAVPKKIRDELGAEMIVAKWYENCLVLVSKEYWQDLIKRLTGEGKLITSPVRDIDRFIYGSAYEVVLDFQGRFVLPDSLLKYASLDDEVEFVGLGDRVEIWSSARWMDLEKIAEQNAAKAIDAISENKTKD